MVTIQHVLKVDVAIIHFKNTPWLSAVFQAPSMQLMFNILLQLHRVSVYRRVCQQLQCDLQ